MANRSRERNLLDLVDFGFFLIAVGAVFVLVPDIIYRLYDFFLDFGLVEVAPSFYLPAPLNPHPEVYYAFFVFSLVFGFLHIPLLAGRFWYRDTLRKKADTFGSIIFWLGVAYVSNLLLTESVTWFGFVGLFLALAGVSIIIENAIVLAVPRKA